MEDELAKLKSQKLKVVSIDVFNWVEQDLVRAKETGNVSYDIKSSLNDPQYKDAIDVLLGEIRNPYIVPTEIKE